MGLKDCLATAAEGGEISREDAARIGREFDRARSRAALDSEATADAEAKIAVAALLKAETEHQKRKAKLALSSIKRIAADVTGHRNARGERDVASAALFLLEHNGEAKFASVAGRQNEITGMAHGRMENLLYTFRRSALLGDKKRLNRAQLPNVVRELFGEDTKDVAAKGLASTWTDTAEWLRQRFNDAGGAIGKLESWGMPQRHDARALRATGLERWRETIRPMLDPSRMTHPLTGNAVHADELDEILGEIWSSIVTDGWDRREPVRQAFGKGSLANQKAEHRFLVFKDADAWLTYQRDFGGGSDPFAAMMGHINMMARDIAALEVMGPNPNGTVEWLKQLVTKEAQLHAAGKPARFTGKPEKALDREARYHSRIDAIWGSIRGATSAPANALFAASAGGTRSFITASVLGGAALSSVSDIGTSMVARRFVGISGGTMGDIIKSMTPATRREAVAAGLILDNAMHVFNKQARYVGTLGGPEWMAYLGDRVLTYSGLTPWTQSAKHAFGMAFLHETAKQSDRAWSQLHPQFRSTFERHGIDERAWDRIRRAQQHDIGSGTKILRPNEIAELDPKLAERFLGMIQVETEYAVPSGGHRSRTLLTGENRPGTVGGEILRSFAQFKSFGAAYALLHGSRIHTLLVGNETKPLGYAYAGSLLISSMFFGAMAMQLKSVAAGRDPQPMTSWEFWGAAALQGGGIGIYGDFLFSDVNRHGGGLSGTIAGPMVERVNDFRELTIGNMIQLANGETTNFGRELVRFARGNVPGGNIWYSRLAWERVVMDQLQFLMDPEAGQAFKRSQANWQRNTGQGFWWEPGRASPSRAPNPANMAASVQS